MLLTATTHSIELATSTAASTDWTIHAADHTASAFTPLSDQGNVASATTTTIVAAPGASTQRQVKMISVVNRSTTVTQTIIFKKDVSGTEYYITPTMTLLPGETAVYTDSTGWSVLDIAGRAKFNNDSSSGITGKAVSFLKIGTVAEAAGAIRSFHGDVGTPGPWSPGTPGLAGRSTDGTTTTDAGCLPISTSSVGSNYLTNFVLSATGTGAHVGLYDYIWVNSGIVLTTTTAQTINSVAFPARDINGSINGEGCHLAMLVTAATGNAGAITNTTVSYTNSLGTPGRTATLPSFPATAVIGTIVWFALETGDTGIQSIQSVTLGTSYVSGSVSLLLVTPLAFTGINSANITNTSGIDPRTGIRLYPGVCINPIAIQVNANAITLTGAAYISTR